MIPNTICSVNFAILAILAIFRDSKCNLIDKFCYFGNFLGFRTQFVFYPIRPRINWRNRRNRRNRRDRRDRRNRRNRTNKTKNQHRIKETEKISFGTWIKPRISDRIDSTFGAWDLHNSKLAMLTAGPKKNAKFNSYLALSLSISPSFNHFFFFKHF